MRELKNYNNVLLPGNNKRLQVIAIKLMVVLGKEYEMKNMCIVANCAEMSNLIFTF